MRGSADLLRRIDRPLLLGNWSYNPIECKFANKPKTTFLVHSSAYCGLLTLLLGHRPDQFELYLGGGKFQPYGIDQFWAWFQLLRQRYYQFQKASIQQWFLRMHRGITAVGRRSSNNDSRWLVI